MTWEEAIDLNAFSGYNLIVNDLEGRANIMLRDYIRCAMRRAHYELIDQPGEPYYGEIPLCPGVQAIGRTLEECRDNLEEALDGWLVLRIRLGLEIPQIEGVQLPQLVAESS